MTKKKTAKTTKSDNVKKMSFTSHFKELRNRLIFTLIFIFIGFIASFAVADKIFNILILPLANAWGSESARGLIYTAMHEKFVSEIKIALYASLFICFPVIFIQIWRFIAPALYKKEKFLMLPFFIATPFLFYAGVAFVYFLVLPVAWNFFLGFEQTSQGNALAINLLPKVNEYLDLVMSLTLAFGICFELPVLLTLLISFNVISAEGLRKWRKIAYLAAFVMAAILTPPDPLSQLALAVPIILLYEVSILFGSRMTAKKET